MVWFGFEVKIYIYISVCFFKFIVIGASFTAKQNKVKFWPKKKKNYNLTGQNRRKMIDELKSWYSQPGIFLYESWYFTLVWSCNSNVSCLLINVCIYPTSLLENVITLVKSTQSFLILFSFQPLIFMCFYYYRDIVPWVFRVLAWLVGFLF